MNNKSVLVIDTPTRCEECEVFNPYEGCPLTGSLGGIDDDCPLKPLPSEYCTNENTDRWFYGYNRAIRDVRGENE